jgi:glutamine synthetase adenylyltransferase
MLERCLEGVRHRTSHSDIELVIVDHSSTQRRARHLIDGLVDSGEATTLFTAYQFLRMVENRLAMMHRASVKAVSEEDGSLRQLAMRIGFRASPAGSPEERMKVEIEHHTELVREMFQQHHP